MVGIICDNFFLGVAKPWEDYDIEVIGNLTVADRVNITTSAKNNLRLILSGELYKVLGFDLRCRAEPEIWDSSVEKLTKFSDVTGDGSFK